MKRVTKPNLKKFVNKMTTFLLSIGAVEFSHISCYKSFKLVTTAGQCEIHIDLNPSVMYTIFSSFDNVPLVNTKAWFKGHNQYSGKYNFHCSAKHQLDNVIIDAMGFFQRTMPQLD